jgi:hypothetical protein
MSTQSETFEAIIKTVDQSSTALRAVSKQIAAMRGEAHAAETQIGRLDQPRVWSTLGTNVKLIDSHFGRLGSTIGSVHNRISALVPALGAFGALASVTGIFAMIGEVADRRTETLDRLAKLGNPDPAKFIALSSAAKLAFVDVEKLDKGLGKLTLNMMNASQGRDKDVLAIFKHLKIDLRDPVTHALRDIGDVVPQLADAIERTASPQMRKLLVSKLFGLRGGAELLPMLQEGGAEMRRLAADMQGAIYRFTPEDDENAKAYRREMILLKASVTGTLDAIGIKLAPVLLPVLKEMRLWLSNPQNRKWLTDTIDENVKGVLKLLQDPKWKNVGADIRYVGHEFHLAIDAVGGLSRVIEILLAYKVLGWGIGFAEGLLRIAGAARAASAALLGVKAAAGEAGAAGTFAPLLLNLTTLAARLSPIGAAIAMLYPTSTAGRELDEAPQKDAKGRPIGIPDSVKLSKLIYEHRGDFHPDFDPRPNWTWGGGAPLPNTSLPRPQISFSLPSAAPSDTAPNGGLRLGPIFGPQLPANIESFPLPRSQLPVRGENLAEGPAPEAKVTIKVDFSNMPIGGRVTTESSGIGMNIRTQTNVGQASPMPERN